LLHLKRLSRQQNGSRFIILFENADAFSPAFRNREYDFGESLPNGPLAEARDDASERSAPAARRGTIAIASTTDASSRLEARPP